MCEPTTILLVVSIAITVAATAAKMQADAQARSAAKKQGEFTAAVARRNAENNEIAALDAERRGELAANQRRSEIKQLIGIQRASLARSGVEVGLGSALDITTDTAGIGELEALNIQANAEREAFALRTRGSNFEAEAQLALLRGDQPSRILSTALGGASSITSSFSTFNAADGFD